ncbi:MAG: histidine kinase dimerization/phospho-acceptor domain-containing protein, partial [Candidatus Hodarchaeota archaeon]
MNSKFKEERMRIVIILILIILSCLLIYYFELIFRTSILVAHFFYFPSILASLWWKKKGLIVPVFLAVILIIFHTIQDYGFFNLESINNFLRGILLIVVSIVVSFLSEHISRREYEFNEIMEDLRRSNEDLQQFAYVASHDLQEPLRAIVSFSQLLEDKYKDIIDKDGKEFIHFITDGAKKMNTLIKDLLLYSRITTHAQPPKLTSLEIILQDALFNLHESIKESGAVITYDELPILKVDKSQFIQLFQNLLSNAIKFRKQETPRIHIGVTKTNN